MSLSNAVTDPDTSADVIVVGAGPAGSTAATYLARAGVDVLLLEKSTFPRDKVCGDGLTPRGVKQVLALGVDVSGPDWIKNKGLRVVGGGTSLELPWPVLQDFPDFGLVRPRRDFDDMLATLAVKAGARMRVAHHGHRAGARRADRPDHRRHRQDRRRPGRVPRPAGAGLRRGVAPGSRSAWASTSATTGRSASRSAATTAARARTNDDYLESHLELWDRTDPAKPKLLPGYGWIFGLGDGTVNVGLGMLSSSKAFGKTDYRALLRTWLDGTPEEWGLREENAHRLDRRRRPADGLQPHPALRRRPAAGRRRRRRGQPVQRRGHRLRDGVGGAGGRVGAAGARPAGGAEPGGGAARLRRPR